MRRVLVILLLAAASIGACAKEGDPVRETLDRMVRAANARDGNALFDDVAGNFQAADGSGRSDAEATVRRYFAAYEILHVAIRDVVIERGADAARVRLRAEMSGQPRRIAGLEGLVPSSSTYDFDLRMAFEGGRWKVGWAQWNPAGSPAP